MPNDPTVQGDPPVKIQRTDEYRTLYANNVVADVTGWDLRLTFGQFDKLIDGSLVNNQHVSVTMPFALAKLMMFWIQLQIAVHEAQTGKIVTLRKDLLPDVPPIPPEHQNDPNFVKMFELMTKARDVLFAGQE